MASVPGLLPPVPASPRAAELRAGRTDIGGRARGRRRAVGRRAAVVLVLAAATGLLVLAGIEVATPDGSGYAQPLDSRIDAWSATHRAGLVVALARHLRLLSTWPALAVLALVAAVGLALWTRRLARGRRLLVAALPLVSVVATEAIVIGVAHAVRRPYPTSVTGPFGYAFPDAPAAALAAIVLTTAIVGGRVAGRGTARRWFTVAAVGLAVALAAPEVVTASRWASDVAAGLVTGALVAVALAELALPRGPGRRPSRPALGAGGVRRGPAVAVVAGALALAMVPAARSYAAALKAPGYADFSVRNVDWLRGHGFSGEVDRAEAWWLWRHLPSTTASILALPPPPAVSARAGAGGSSLAGVPRVQTGPSAIAPLVTPVLAGEGRWTIEATGPGGAPAIAVARLRPDPAHRTVTASLAWMDPAAVRFSVIAGTRQPAGHAGADGAEVPPSLRGTLLAAFNLGFKMSDTPGGALEEGMSAGALQAGLATVVVHTDGTATVGAWGRDVSLGPDVAAVRQNLRLIVDGGQVVPGLFDDPAHQWGKLSWLLPAWRSGVGVDASGHLIYAGGNQLTLDALAQALHQAGAVRAMELDMHNHMVTYNLFSQLRGGTPVGHKLSPDMTESPQRYLGPDQRDFVAVYAR